MTPKRLIKLISDLRTLPRVSIDLRCVETAGNDPFFEGIVRDFYREAMSRHRKFPLVRQYQYGVTVCHLTTFEAYFRLIESAGRRNYKKSQRLGYAFERIDPNVHLGDVTAILRSTPVRQGPMPTAMFQKEASACTDPVSRSPLHDYPYFGILRNGRLYAFAACLIAGDLCIIQTIYGHSDHQADGIVPMLIIDMAKYVTQQHPNVKYYSYGTYFGASNTMQRFKRKFGFKPHHVHWILGA